MRSSTSVRVYLIARGGTPPFSFCLCSSSLRATRSHFPLLPAQNLENVDEIMLWFKGRKEELGEALHLMREQNMVQWRAQVAVRRTAGLEARARAPTIPRPLHPPRGPVPRGRRLPPGPRRPPLRRQRPLVRSLDLDDHFHPWLLG